MKKLILTLAVIPLLAGAIAAQTAASAIDTIRARYNEVAEKARLAESDEDLGRLGGLVMNELSINKLGHQWRAVGIYEQTYKFFYAGGDSEKHLYPDRLVFVISDRKVSAREYYEEFLFAERGDLIFYFQRTENDAESAGETRLYLKASKVIRVIEDGKMRDRPTAKDAAAAKQMIDKARELRELFDRSIKL